MWSILSHYHQSRLKDVFHWYHPTLNSRGSADEQVKEK